MDGIIGGLLGYLQDPRRTQQVQGIGNALERGLLNIQQGDERFRALADRAFDPQNPGRIRDPEALKELTNMTMGLLSFAPVGMTKSIKMPIDYGLQHRPMTEASGASRLHEAYKSFGEDVYGKNALQYFGGGDNIEKESLKILQKMRDNPDAEVTIYRGVPKGVKEINPGDWIALDPKIASEYGNVISKKVKVKDITTWPDSLAEFGYYPDVLK